MHAPYNRKLVQKIQENKNGLQKYEMSIGRETSSRVSNLCDKCDTRTIIYI